MDDGMQSTYALLHICCLGPGHYSGIRLESTVAQSLGSPSQFAIYSIAHSQMHTHTHTHANTLPCAVIASLYVSYCRVMLAQVPFMIMKHKSAERQLKITNETIARTRDKLDAYADTVSVRRRKPFLACALLAVMHNSI
jgi:hypothetical protein